MANRHFCHASASVPGGGTALSWERTEERSRAAYPTTAEARRAKIEAEAERAKRLVEDQPNQIIRV